METILHEYDFDYTSESMLSPYRIIAINCWTKRLYWFRQIFHNDCVLNRVLFQYNCSSLLEKQKIQPCLRISSYFSGSMLFYLWVTFIQRNSYLANCRNGNDTFWICKPSIISPFSILFTFLLGVGLAGYFIL